MTKQLSPLGGTKGKYACLLFDSTLKTVLGTQAHADLFIDILKLLIPDKHITSLTLLNKEYHGLINSEKSATFDLLCRDDDTGEEFLVELQNADKKSFRERVLFYSYFPIREQLENKRNKLAKEDKLDKMDYSINPVYVVSIVNFKLAHEHSDTLEDGYISRYELRSGKTGEQYTKALNFVFLELGQLPFGPEEDDKCRTRLEKFAFALKYMHTFEAFPPAFEEDPLLGKLAAAAKLANMTMEQLKEYESDMRTEIDRWAEINFARDDERQRIAKAMLADGLAPEQVAKYSGLTPEQLAKLQDRNL